MEPLPPFAFIRFAGDCLSFQADGDHVYIRVVFVSENVVSDHQEPYVGNAQSRLFLDLARGAVRKCFSCFKVSARSRIESLHMRTATLAEKKFVTAYDENSDAYSRVAVQLFSLLVAPVAAEQVAKFAFGF